VAGWGQPILQAAEIEIDDRRSEHGQKLAQCEAANHRIAEWLTKFRARACTRGIISLFSARQPPQGGELPAPLFPEQLPEGAEYDRLVQRVMKNEIIRGNCCRRTAS
jgi:hypothetical protein